MQPWSALDEALEICVRRMPRRHGEVARMAMFQYEAMNTAGQKVTAEIDADNGEQAIARIRAMGQFPTRVKPARRAKGSAKNAGTTRRKTFSMSFSRVSTRVLAEFTQQLSILQDAGLPIVRSLKILWQQE